jgi:hypothetical protein
LVHEFERADVASGFTRVTPDAALVGGDGIAGNIRAVRDGVNRRTAG